MIPVLALALLANTLSAPRSLDVVFVADAPAVPPLVILVENAGRHRALAWAFAGGGDTQASGLLADEAGNSSSLSLLPAAPSGATLVERGGAISIFLDDAGSWQDPFKVFPAGPAQPLPVAEPRGLRLVVFGSQTGQPVTAALYGQGVRIVGRAVIRSDQPSAFTVVSDERSVWSGVGAIQAETASCGPAAPEAPALGDAPAFSMSANGPSLCVGTIAVVPLIARLVGRNNDTAARGVSVIRTDAVAGSASPSPVAAPGAPTLPTSAVPVTSPTTAAEKSIPAEPAGASISHPVPSAERR